MSDREILNTLFPSSETSIGQMEEYEETKEFLNNPDRRRELEIETMAKRIRDILYDMATAGEGECPTVEEIEAQLQSTKGSAYILESLVQFLTGSDEVYKTAMELIHNMEQADDGQAEEESADNLDPCDIPDENGNHHCPYEDYSGYEGERCRVCCGHGVDE